MSGEPDFYILASCLRIDPAFDEVPELPYQYARISLLGDTRNAPRNLYVAWVEISGSNQR
jgi:hypothetical protein